MLLDTCVALLSNHHHGCPLIPISLWWMAYGLGDYHNLDPQLNLVVDHPWKCRVVHRVHIIMTFLFHSRLCSSSSKGIPESPYQRLLISCNCYSTGGFCQATTIRSNSQQIIIWVCEWGNLWPLGDLWSRLMASHCSRKKLHSVSEVYRPSRLFFIITPWFSFGSIQGVAIFIVCAHPRSAIYVLPKDVCLKSVNSHASRGMWIA